jgi:hypothetical protein
MASIFELANRDLAALFPGGPAPFTDRHPKEHLEEALELALQYSVESAVLLICSDVAFANNRCHRPRRRYATVLPPRPTLTQGENMIPVARKITTHRVKMHRIPHFRRELFVYVTAYLPRLLRTLHPYYSPSRLHPTWRARTSSQIVG